MSHPRPEHIAAITWLNEVFPVSFYMVKLEAIKIGRSPAAPLFTLIVDPSEEAKTIGLEKKELAEGDINIKKWFSALVERSKPITKLHAHISPNSRYYIGVSTGTRGVGLIFTQYHKKNALQGFGLIEVLTKKKRMKQYSMNF